MHADALSKWVIFKAIFKDLAGDEGKIKGQQREKREDKMKLNSLRRLKTQKDVEC